MCFGIPPYTNREGLATALSDAIGPPDVEPLCFGFPSLLDTPCMLHELYTTKSLCYPTNTVGRAPIALAFDLAILALDLVTLACARPPLLLFWSFVLRNLAAGWLAVGFRHSWEEWGRNMAVPFRYGLVGGRPSGVYRLIPASGVGGRLTSL